MTLASKNMGPYRPNCRHNCRAQFRSRYLSSSEARVANNQAQPLKAEQGSGKSKKWIPLVNSDLCGLLRSQAHWIASVLSLREPARPNQWIGGGDSKYSSGCFWTWQASLYKYHSAGGDLQGIIFKPIISFPFSICLCFSAEGMGAFLCT